MRREPPKHGYSRRRAEARVSQQASEGSREARPRRARQRPAVDRALRFGAGALARPAGVAGLWAISLVFPTVLAYDRYKQAFAQTAPPADFTIFFQAGHAVASGHSPYSVHGYVYPPFLALLLAPFAHLSKAKVFHGWIALSLLAIGLAVACILWVERKDLRSWQHPLLFALFTVTGLHFWPLVIELPDGQSDTITFAILVLAYAALSTRRATTAGVLIAVAGLIKGWPAFLALTLLRRGQPNRGRSLLSFAAVISVAPLCALVLGGAGGPSSMVRAVLHASVQPRLASYSVWGVPRLAFARTTIGHPLVVSSVFRGATTALLLAWVMALLLMTLMQRDTDRSISFWNVVFCVVLLLPISHLTYTIYLLPVLWLWGIHAVRSYRVERVSVACLALVVMWWLVISQSAFGEDRSQVSAMIVFFTNLLACSASVLSLRLLGRVQPGHATRESTQWVGRAREVLASLRFPWASRKLHRR